MHLTLIAAIGLSINPFVTLAETLPDPAKSDQTSLSHPLIAVAPINRSLEPAMSEPDLAGSEREPYPPKFAEAFMTGCASNASQKTFCECILRGLQNQYSFGEAQNLIAYHRQTGRLPEEVQSVAASCFDPQ